MPSLLKPRPRLAAQASAGPEKLWPQPDLRHWKGVNVLKAKNRLSRRLAPSLLANAAWTEDRPVRRRMLGALRRSLHDKGQQACPIRPQNDRFPMRAQAGIPSHKPMLARYFGRTPGLLPA